MMEHTFLSWGKLPLGQVKHQSPVAKAIAGQGGRQRGEGGSEWREAASGGRHRVEGGSEWREAAREKTVRAMKASPTNDMKQANNMQSFSREVGGSSSGLP